MEAERLRESLLVTTRATRKKQEEEAEEYRKKMDCGVQSSAIDENEEVWMKELDADLFSGGKNEAEAGKKREERREEKVTVTVSCGRGCTIL